MSGVDSTFAQPAATPGVEGGVIPDERDRAAEDKFKAWWAENTGTLQMQAADLPFEVQPHFAARAAYIAGYAAASQYHIIHVVPEQAKEEVEVKRLLGIIQQVRFIAAGRYENDDAPEGVTTDWRRLLQLCDAAALRAKGGE